MGGYIIILVGFVVVLCVCVLLKGVVKAKKNGPYAESFFKRDSDFSSLAALVTLTDFFGLLLYSLLYIILPPRT